MDRIGRLLIVEDDESLCKYLRDSFDEYFEVEIRHDGQAGYDAAVVFLPDLIIADVRMPILSGLSMLKRIRRTPALKTVAVILLTVLNKDEDKIRGYESLADLYFTKPFNISELIAAAIGLVRIRHQLKATFTHAKEEMQLVPALTEDDTHFLADLSKAVQSRIADFDLTVDDIARAIHLSRRQLERRLRSIEGITPGQYIRQVRLETAKQMADSGRIDSIKILASKVGFRDRRTFVNRFKALFGHPPRID